MEAAVRIELTSKGFADRKNGLGTERDRAILLDKRANRIRDLSLNIGQYQAQKSAHLKRRSRGLVGKDKSLLEIER
jgi:hypothetical protein